MSTIEPDPNKHFNVLLAVDRLLREPERTEHLLLLEKTNFEPADDV